MLHLADLLSRHYLFRDLDKGVVERLEALATPCHLSASQTLFLQGDAGDALYGVLSGRIRISSGAAGGKQIFHDIMEPGDIFGEIALIDGLPRTADATAMTAAELIMIRRPAFLEFLEHEPALALHLLKLLCERVRRTSERIEDSAFLTMPARLAKRVLNLAARDGTATEQMSRVRLSQSELARMLDLSRETINKQLQRWHERGWVELTRGQLIVHNAEALRRLVQTNQDV
jgi:CRP/FNR family transcriptional regulator, cyclic AMP receptor protein